MISFNINNNRNNITFTSIKNTSKITKAISSTTKNNAIKPLVMLSCGAGMETMYHIFNYSKCNSGNAYNEKESNTEDGSESENVSTVLKDLKERKIPDFREFEFDEDFMKELENLDETPIEMDDFKKESVIIKNRKIKTIAETICKKEQLSKPLLYYIRDFDAGLENVTDSKIHKHINSELKRLANIDYIKEQYNDSKFGELDYFISLSNLAEIVDIYNTMTRKYSRYKEADIDMPVGSVLLKETKPAVYIKNLGQHSPKNLQNFIKALSIDEEKKHPLVADFESLLKTEALDMLSNKKELLDYMYEKYYIKKITDVQAKKLCREINNLYGVRVLLSNKTHNIRKALIVIKDELEAWTRVSDGKARLPKILDLNSCDIAYETATAYSDIRGNIHHNGARIFSPTVIRHEIMHLNENLIFASLATNDKQAKLIRSIIKVKKIKIGNILDWDNCKYREEFLKAGISPNHIKYAYTNAKELLSVAAEGDFSQYSPEFKEVLMQIGMPKYVFDLPVNNVNIEINVNRIKKIMKEHPDASYDELVKYVEEKKLQELSPQEKLLSILFGKTFK